MMKEEFPTILVLFGATGDLVARKIAPALYVLFQAGQLPSRFKVVGVARRSMSDDEFRSLVSDAVATKLKGIAPDPKFLKFFAYQQLLFDTQADYRKLAMQLKAVDDEWGLCTNKLFYLATPPKQYSAIVLNLAVAGLTDGCSPEEGWTRLLIEKPYGDSLEHTQSIERLLGNIFEEKQIYRIDHYLGKDMVQQALNFRSVNPMFEAIWDHEHIERIDIKLLEEIDIEGRGEFYDRVGALVDVGQNHLLQMLALLTMNISGTDSIDAFRSARVNILNSLMTFDARQVGGHVLRAQYKGYRGDGNVADESRTETYFKIKTHLDNDRWRGVPIYLEAGKKIEALDKSIVVTFRHREPCHCPNDQHLKNQIIFRIEPNPAIVLRFLIQQSADEIVVRETILWSPSVEEKTRYTREYARLLDDAFRGDQKFFISREEAIASWQFVDPILKMWRESTAPLYIY